MKIAIIGGGPAGMIAGITAAKSGHSVTLFEKNEKLGKKLYITGKGRCNFTNADGDDAFFSHVLRNPRFLYSAYHACRSADIIRFFEELGIETKTERGGRVFPASDKSSDIIRALQRELEHVGARVRLNSRVSELYAPNSRIHGLRLQDGGLFEADAIILATGGLSYPATGSTGDGYAFAQSLGHTLVSTAPALVPLETQEHWPTTLAGLSLKNVSLRAVDNGKTVYDELGELLFTHFGVSGPLVLTLSSYIADNPSAAQLFIDLKPGLTHEQLNKRLLRDLEQARKAQIGNAFSSLLPHRLLPVVLYEAHIDGSQTASECSRHSRSQLAATLKALPLTIRQARPFTEAIITRGGISTKEIQPGTMESKLVKGLYFAGEIIDTDAATGGYNLQIAWSTGMLAGTLKE